MMFAVLNSKPPTGCVAGTGRVAMREFNKGFFVRTGRVAIREFNKGFFVRFTRGHGSVIRVL